MEWRKDGYLITDDRRRISSRRTWELLQATYWGVRRPHDTVEKMIAGSLCFGLFVSDEQIGFGRAVTDYAVFSWIADVVLDGKHRGRGLGKWMMECIVGHPSLDGTQFVLQTRDAHALYEEYGFQRSSALKSTSVIGL